MGQTLSVGALPFPLIKPQCGLTGTVYNSIYIYDCNLNSMLLYEISSLQLATRETFALCCTSIFVFHMKAFQATLSLSAGGLNSQLGSAHNFAGESDEFTTPY